MLILVLILIRIKKKNNVSTRTDIWFSTLKLPLFNRVFDDFYIKKRLKDW